MAEPLARLLGDLDAPRGPDATFRIEVPYEWLAQRLEVAIMLPGRMQCARCAGGGCDACQRSGALQVPLDQSIVVTLPAPAADGQEICLRLPQLGGVASREELPRGHLLLTIRVGAASCGVVRQVEPDETPRRVMVADRQLMVRSTVMAALVTLLFLGMLRLSGWL